jgi:hypothetical protein
MDEKRKENREEEENFSFFFLFQISRGFPKWESRLSYLVCSQMMLFFFFFLSSYLIYLFIPCAIEKERKWITFKEPQMGPLLTYSNVSNRERKKMIKGKKERRASQPMSWQQIHLQPRRRWPNVQSREDPRASFFRVLSRLCLLGGPLSRRPREQVELDALHIV